MSERIQRLRAAVKDWLELTAGKVIAKIGGQGG